MTARRRGHELTLGVHNPLVAAPRTPPGHGDRKVEPFRIVYEALENTRLLLLFGD